MNPDTVSKIRTLCFIPMKNCENSIENTLRGFQGEILSHLDEILVIDNASTDQSVQVSKECLAKITKVKTSLFQNSRNYGLGGSHKIAFKYAYDNGYDFILVVHGDNSSDVNQFLPLFKKSDYFKWDMILSTRLAFSGKRVNYPTSRLWVNRLLSLFASITTITVIKDFSSGPVNLYRVESFLNNFENPLKRFTNDVSFPQYLTLYGVFRRMEIKFHSIDHFERDVKPVYKLVTQFGKSIILLLKFMFLPRKTIKHDVYGTYFGHNYRKVKISESVEDLVIEKVKPLPAKELVKETEHLPVVTAPTSKIETNKNQNAPIKLVDLRPLIGRDTFLESYNNIKLSTIESCDLVDEGYLLLKFNLNVNNVISKGLKSLLLRLFKIYSQNNILLEIRADKILKSRQFFEFIKFCKDFKLNTTLISSEVEDEELWKNISPLVDNVTLNFDNSMDRVKFYKVVKTIASKTNVVVNILSHPVNFYQSYGLKKKIESEGKCTSIMLQPYLIVNNETIPEDHLEVLLDQQSISEINGNSDFRRRHHLLAIDGNLKNQNLYNQLLDQGFNDLIMLNGKKIKTLIINDEGELFLNKQGQSESIGSFFEESNLLIDRLISN